MNTLYAAIHLAADHIERNPSEFDFSEYAIPIRCGSPGCAIGWVGFFSSYGTYSTINDSIMGVSESTFYDRMDDISAALYSNTDWIYRADLCAAVLRAYARRYHKPIPDSVRELFSETVRS